jgi:aspartate aminotransferase-like enzyme
MHAIDDSSKGPSGVMEVPKRFLMGPGPANADPRVLTAQALPLLGHMCVVLTVVFSLVSLVIR